MSDLYWWEQDQHIVKGVVVPYTREDACAELWFSRTVILGLEIVCQILPHRIKDILARIEYGYPRDYLLTALNLESSLLDNIFPLKINLLEKQPEGRRLPNLWATIDAVREEVINVHTLMFEGITHKYSTITRLIVKIDFDDAMIFALQVDLEDGLVSN